MNWLWRIEGRQLLSVRPFVFYGSLDSFQEMAMPIIKIVLAC